MPALETVGIIGSPKRTYQAAAANMSKGLFVVQGADDNHVAIVSAANAVVLGLVEEDTVSIGDPISIVRWGEGIAVIGAAVASGALLKVNAAGQVIPSTGAGDNVVGQAISTGVNAGDYIAIEVFKTPAGGSAQVVYETVAGAIPVQTGTYDIGSAGALAMTLAAPVAGAPSAGGQDGINVFISASTAHAHTITTPANGINGNKHVVTFAAVGDGVELRAINGGWRVVALAGGAALS